jgi:hypothetical protein
MRGTLEPGELRPEPLQGPSLEATRFDCSRRRLVASC